jgi:hypothetical protein
VAAAAACQCNRRDKILLNLPFHKEQLPNPPRRPLATTFCSFDTFKIPHPPQKGPGKKSASFEQGTQLSEPTEIARLILRRREPHLYHEIRGLGLFDEVSMLRGNPDSWHVREPNRHLVENSARYDEERVVLRQLLQEALDVRRRPHVHLHVHFYHYNTFLLSRPTLVYLVIFIVTHCCLSEAVP